ncbi:MAG: serine protease [Nanoarchaeota archaeon]|nr:serine protease [Nanoarchaeota archaeon]
MKKLIVSGALILSLLIPSYAAKTTSTEKSSKTQVVQIMKDGKYDNHNTNVDESKYSLEDVLKSIETIYHEITYSVSYTTLDDEEYSTTINTGGMGTGIVIEKKDGKAYVITNSHVVTERQALVFMYAQAFPPVPIKEYNIKKIEDRIYVKKGVLLPFDIDGKVVAEDATLDIALLEFDQDEKFDEFPYDIGDSDNLEVGDFIWGIGNPLGLEDYVLKGNISKKHYPGRDDRMMLGFDAQPGYSGGAIIAIKDGKFELVGVVVAGLIRPGTPPKEMKDALAGYSIGIPIDPIMEMIEKYFEKEKEKDRKTSIVSNEPIVID